MLTNWHISSDRTFAKSHILILRTDCTFCELCRLSCTLPLTVVFCNRQISVRIFCGSAECLPALTHTNLNSRLKFVLETFPFLLWTVTMAGILHFMSYYYEPLILCYLWHVYKWKQAFGRHSYARQSTQLSVYAYGNKRLQCRAVSELLHANIHTLTRDVWDFEPMFGRSFLTNLVESRSGNNFGLIESLVQ